MTREIRSTQHDNAPRYIPGTSMMREQAVLFRPCVQKSTQRLGSRLNSPISPHWNPEVCRGGHGRNVSLCETAVLTPQWRTAGRGCRSIRGRGWPFGSRNNFPRKAAGVVSAAFLLPRLSAHCAGRARRARNYVHGRRTTEDKDHFTRGLRTSHAKEKRTKRNKANRPTNTVARMLISRPSNRREISSSHNRMATQLWPDRIGKWYNRRIGVPGSIAAGCRGHRASCGYAWIRRQSVLPVSI